MVITYVWHDCFVADCGCCTLVFDYWKDPTAAPGELPAFIRDADKCKPMYVIVSHHHKDHFSKRIFSWKESIENIHYILSNDVRKFSRHILQPGTIYAGPRLKEGEFSILRAGESYSDNILRIDAFGSTDVGCSYVVTVGGITVFHAGDLNAWIWKDESTEQEINKAMGDYKAILSTIKGRFPAIDYAMFPVDSRIGRDYFTGAALFVREINVGHFFPMHFGLGETLGEQMKYRLDAARLNLYANTERGEYICLQAPYSSFVDSRSPEHA